MDQGATRQDGTITPLVKHDETTHHNIIHVVEEVVMTMGIITMTIITTPIPTSTPTTMAATGVDDSYCEQLEWAIVH